MELTAEILEKAIIYATNKHQGQIRKGDGNPYIIHPLRVMLTLMDIKISKNKYLLAVSTIMHDVSEDCNVSIQEIANEFGYNVASIVEELTSDKDKIEEKGKAQYLLDKMINMSSYSLCIKLCDRLDNIKDMKSMNKKFIEKYINETNFILEGLKNRKLSKTHNKIIKLIKKEISKY